MFNQWVKNKVDLFLSEKIIFFKNNFLTIFMLYIFKQGFKYF